MTAAKQSIHQKLAAAINEVDRIGKDGRNDHFKYTYTSAEQVYRVVRGPLLAQGLVVIPSVQEWSQQGQNMVLTLGLTITDTDSGDSISATWVGEGQDKGDKASYKAATGGMKTWLKHLFMLPADDDPEADSSTDRPPEPLPFNMERLAQASNVAKLPSSKRAAVGGWVGFDGESLVEHPDRLKTAIERIEAGDVDGLMSMVEAQS
jgi:hypothetical protein